MKRTIYLAGGCFWGVEEYFSRLKGTIATEVGYANGTTENPTYEDLKQGRADHAETLRLDYDDAVLPLEKIVEHFLRFVDPHSVDKQGHDVGHQYRSGIYSNDEDERELIANLLKAKVGENHKIAVTPLLLEAQAAAAHMLGEHCMALALHEVDHLPVEPGIYPTATYRSCKINFL